MRGLSKAGKLPLLKGLEPPGASLAPLIKAVGSKQQAARVPRISEEQGLPAPGDSSSVSGVTIALA